MKKLSIENYDTAVFQPDMPELIGLDFFEVRCASIGEWRYLIYDGTGTILGNVEYDPSENDFFFSARTGIRLDDNKIYGLSICMDFIMAEYTGGDD